MKAYLSTAAVITVLLTSIPEQVPVERIGTDEPTDLNDCRGEWYGPIDPALWDWAATAAESATERRDGGAVRHPYFVLDASAEFSRLFSNRGP
jgi:hypothetical protein